MPRRPLYSHAYRRKLRRPRDRDRWFVRVAIPSLMHANTLHYAMGPLGSWTRARHVASRWEREFGPETAKVCVTIPIAVDRRIRAMP